MAIRIFVRSLQRARCRAAILVAGSALLGVAPASGDDIGPSATGSEIRVLLMETNEPLRVRGGSAGAKGTTVRPIPGGLQAGGRDVGDRWRVAGGGVLSAGDLRVRGSLELRRAGSGLQVINRLPVEDYVAGTVGREVYTHWNPETLKAQAVVARTYALHQRARGRGRRFDLSASTRSQVYGGVAAETPAVSKATRATRGQYLVFDREPILAVYHSASGGRTASAEEVWGLPMPYLVSLPVEEEEDSPDTYWRASVSGTTLSRALALLGVDVGTLRVVRVSARSPSGRARWVEIRGEDGSEKVEARAVRRVLGAGVIRSTLFEIRNAEGGFVFVGSGHGHGVGMSQWGAQSMAERGADYREILAKFYPGTSLASLTGEGAR